MSGARHYDEVLQDLIDGRLAATTAAEVEAHLASCAECREEKRRLEAGRAAARTLRATLALPPGLAAQVAAALDDEARGPHAPATDSQRHRAVGRWGWAAAAAAAIIAAVALASWWARGSDAATLVAGDLRAITAGELPLEIETSDAQALQEHFATGEGLHVRVIDLAMMGFTLQGGRRHDVGSRPGALYVYRSAAGDLIICEMYAGGGADLPPSSDIRDSGGFRFHVVRRDDVTLVFWLEGNVVCVLASTIAPEELVKLAIAKAMAPA